MIAVAGSLYLVSTLVFAVFALVVGMRLVALSRRTGEMPERLLGAGLQLTAFWGYGVMIFAIVVRDALGANEHPLGIAIMGAAWLAHDVGVVCMLLFIRRVFRPDAGWAMALATVLTMLLFVGLAGYAATGGLVTAIPNGWYWLGFAAIGGYPIWMSIESTIYWQRMRRRMALGLASPMVADRFRIWALASGCAAGAIWIVNVPTWLGIAPNDALGSTVTSLAMCVTACFGMATVGLYWVAFFPPAWYRSRVESRAAAQPAA